MQSFVFGAMVAQHALPSTRIHGCEQQEEALSMTLMKSDKVLEARSWDWGGLKATCRCVENVEGRPT